jgi:RyR domain
MTASSEPIAITVVGDVIVDRHFYHSDDGVVEIAELGGAVGLLRLLNETIEATNASSRIAVRLGMDTPEPTEFPPASNAYAVWAPCRQSKTKDEPKIWRAIRPMGYADHGNATGTKFSLKRTDRLVPRILVLDDGGLDFRQRANKALWSLPAENEPKPDCIILKTSRPVARGDLWHELIQNYADRLICIVSANEMREECVVLSKGVSWEKTIEDIDEALANNPALKTLGVCRQLVVNFSIDGALCIDRTGANAPKATLIFDPERTEGEWGGMREGAAFGYLTCMAAAVAHTAAMQLVVGKSELNLARAIRSGLAAMRDLLENGHGVIGPRPSGFPAARLAKLIGEAKGDLSVAPVVWPRPAAAKGEWMMASDVPSAPEGDRQSVIFGLARQLVTTGYGALRGVPHARFGDLVTADRSEIEALRGLRQLMRDYRAMFKADKPLSIGVFGPPGAGKSFGVKQLAKEVFGDKAWLEFNLAQFDGPGDLVGAFHQVRDKALSGETPVVLWDEFDSRACFWLQYLLAPMQDGKFQDGQLNHSIGKCVFVFAGGTSVNFKGFKPKAGDETAKADFRLKKGPDFKSRLDGYYDVLGPNPRGLRDEPEMPDPTDLCAPLRRALLMRVWLAGKSNVRLDVDSDLLDALLTVDRYAHGARSLEKLVSPLKSAPGQPIRRSSLPPPARLAMHVNAETFNKILDRNASYRGSETIEKLAEWMHEAWRKGDYMKKPHLDVPYAKLAPIDKEDNRAAARRIPEVLALVGLSVATLEEAKSMKKPAKKDIGPYIEAQIERLAEAEHDGWMTHRAKNGWNYGTADDDRKLHPSMVPYSQLPEAEKDKDRSAVRNYPKQVELAGLAIVWLSLAND